MNATLKDAGERSSPCTRRTGAGRVACLAALSAVPHLLRLGRLADAAKQSAAGPAAPAPAPGLFHLGRRLGQQLRLRVNRIEAREDGGG